MSAKLPAIEAIESIEVEEVIEAVKVPPELIMVGDIGLSSWLITEVEKLIEGSQGSAHLGNILGGFEFQTKILPDKTIGNLKL